MSFELFVALRYLLARRKQAFISIISVLSTIGVVVGVMALVIALALMTGLQGELRDRILGSTAHVYVWVTGGIDPSAARQVTDIQRAMLRGGLDALSTRSDDQAPGILLGRDLAQQLGVGV